VFHLLAVLRDELESDKSVLLASGMSSPGVVPPKPAKQNLLPTFEMGLVIFFKLKTSSSE
jgi:hypothetical protein